MIDDGGREVFEESASPREVDVSPARTLSDGRLTERTELLREGNGKAEFLSREGPLPSPPLFPPFLPPFSDTGYLMIPYLFYPE